MASYYTRAKARSEVEPEDLEPSDSASVTTTTIASSIHILRFPLQVDHTVVSGMDRILSMFTFVDRLEQI